MGCKIVFSIINLQKNVSRHHNDFSMRQKVKIILNNNSQKNRTSCDLISVYFTLPKSLLFIVDTADHEHYLQGRDKMQPVLFNRIGLDRLINPRVTRDPSKKYVPSLQQVLFMAVAGGRYLPSVACKQVGVNHMCPACTSIYRLPYMLSVTSTRLGI